MRLRLYAVLSIALAAASTQAAEIDFGPPVFVDDRACGTEPWDAAPLLPHSRSAAAPPPGPVAYRVRPIFYNPRRSHRFRIEIMPSPEDLRSVEIWVRDTAGANVERPLEINDEGRFPDRRADDGSWTAIYRSRAGEQPLFRYVVHTDPPRGGFSWVTPLPVSARPGMPDPVRVSSSVQYTDALVNLKNKKLLKSRFREARTSAARWYAFTHRQLAEIYQTVTDEFGDRFDFLAVVNAGTRVTHSNRYYSGLYNDTQGIGRSRFDIRDRVGSDSLQGIVTYPVPSLFPGGMALVHEIAHRWLVFLPPPYGSEQGAHWPRGTAGACSIMGVNGFGGQGVIFPYKISRRNSGYQVRRDCDCRSDEFKGVELYLMGLRGKGTDRQEVFNFEDQTQQAPGFGCGDSVTWHGPVTRFDSRRIARQLGDRVPRSGSQRFRTVAVLISEQLLSKETMVYLDEAWKADAELFRQATRGAGRLLVELD